MLEEERAHVERLIFEMTSGYFGWDEEHIRRADTIEIKIGQSAKAGSGGLLPATKVTERIAQVRGLRAGEDAHSPARFPDIHTVAELRARVEEIRALVEGRPVGIKFAAGRGEEDLAAAIDGRGGGTGAAPVVLKDNLTVPIQYALHRARAPRGARRRRPRHRGDGVLPHVGGRDEGDRDGRDGGRDGDGLDDRDRLPAVPRVPHRQLPGRHRTQRPDLEARFDVELSSERGAATLRAFRAEIELLCGAVGVLDIHDLTTDDLATLDSELAAHTAIRHA